MPIARPPIRTLVLLLAAFPVSAQTPTAPSPRPATTPRPARKAPRPLQPPYNFNLIVLDPAHGGTDPGAHLTADALEKDATLAFAKSLRELLTPRGITVVLTHESAAIPAPPPKPPEPDPDNPDTPAPPPPPPPSPNANNPTPEQRVEQANRSRPVACLLIHASNGGHGVHLYTSALTPASSYTPDPDPANRPIIPWDTAQAPSLAQSTQLASDLAAALAGIRIPTVVGRDSMRPIDSLTCPAVVIELAPLGTGSSGTPASDTAYQQRVAQAIATALDLWRNRQASQFQARLAAQQQAQQQSQQPASSPTSPALPPKPKPRPKPVPIPSESPLAPDTSTPPPPHRPAPIIRRDPGTIPPSTPPSTEPSTKPGATR